MATTDQINALIGGYTDLKDYFEGVRASIDAKVEALTGSLNVSLYVDSLYGDDTAVGTDAEPLLSVAEAVRRIPSGGHGAIFLKRSATLAEKVSTRARTVLIRSTASASPAFKSDWYEDADGLWRPGQIDFNGVAGGVIFNEITVQFANRAAGTRADAWASGLVTTNSLTPAAFVGFANSTIYRFPGADAFLLAASINSGSINVASSVTYTSAMDGYWCAGVAAGTASADTRFNTNLATL